MFGHQAAISLNSTRQSPVVLIGGGIGLAPVLSMVNYIVDTGSKRETWFFYGVKDGTEHAMKDHLQKIDKNMIIFILPRVFPPARRRRYGRS